MSFTSYSVDNDNRFKAALKRAAETTDDLRVPFSLILADFYKSEQAIFKLQGPGQYPDFKSGDKSVYAKYKEAKVGFKYPLLVRSGKLAASLTNAANAGAVAIVGTNSLIIGTSVDYGIYHQSDAPRKKIPLRKFLFIGPEAPAFATSEMQGRPQRWLNIMNDFVLKKMKVELS